MERQSQTFVRDVMESSVLELFDTYGMPCAVSVDTSADKAEGVELGSIVGFRGKGVRGGLAFVAPLSLLEKLLPVPRDEARSDIQLRDWSAEIANQLVGRIKNKLSSKTLDFDVGTPVCFTGKSIRLVFLPDADGTSLLLDAQGTLVRVHLDCTLSPELAEGVIEPLRIIPEGDVILF
jgi:CheY-specific phosphatase CheX